MVRRLLVAVLGLALLAACDGSGDVSDAEPSPSATSDASGTASTSPSASPTDPGPVVECPSDIVEPDPALPDAVPEGATSVRLCRAAPGEIDAPLDALTTNVTGVVQAVNDQRIVTRPCADHRLPTYQLAFGYPDGTRFVVAGRFTYCGELLVGSARRAHAQPALDRFVRLLADQRAGTTPPAEATVTPDQLHCGKTHDEGAWRTWPLNRPESLSVAVLCFGIASQPRHARRVTIPARDMAELTASMRRDRSSSAGMLGCGVFSRREYWIIGANAWGDPITLTKGCFGLALTPNALEWAPRKPAREVLDRLVARAR